MKILDSTSSQRQTIITTIYRTTVLELEDKWKGFTTFKNIKKPQQKKKGQRCNVVDSYF